MSKQKTLSEDDLRKRYPEMCFRLQLPEPTYQTHNINATVRLDPDRDGHGIIIELFAETMFDPKFLDKKYMYAIIHGQYDNTLTPWEMFNLHTNMPLQLRLSGFELQKIEGDKKFKFKVGGKISHRLSHATIFRTLDKMIKGGDDLICIQLMEYENTELSWAMLTVKPSLIKESLLFNEETKPDAKRPTIRYDGDLSDLKPRLNFYHKVMFVLIPLLWILCAFLLVFSDHYNKKIMEKTIVFRNPFSSAASSIESLSLGNVGKISSYTLGRLHQRYSMNGSNKLSILEEATKIVGLKTRKIGHSEFENILESLKSIEYVKIMYQRVFGMLSIVNVIWFFAMLSIVYTAGPVFMLVTRPLRAFLAKHFTWVAKAIKKFIMEDLVPILIKLHKWGFV